MHIELKTINDTIRYRGQIGLHTRPINVTLHSGDYNNIRKAVEYCVKNNISLERANLEKAHLKGARLYESKLSFSNLSNANLKESNLSNANLKESNLSNANLSHAKLSGSCLMSSLLTGADLSNAILKYADLRWVNLTGANLMGSNLTQTLLEGTKLKNTNIRLCTGNGKEIETIETDVYPIVICHPTQEMAIGLEQHSIDKWMDFTDDELSNMDKRISKFWNEWKPKIEKKWQKN